MSSLYLFVMLKGFLLLVLGQYQGGLIDCDAAFLTEILEGVQVQRLPDVIFMRIVLLSNKVHEDMPDINFFLLCIREPFLSSLSGFCWKRVMIFV